MTNSPDHDSDRTVRYSPWTNLEREVEVLIRAVDSGSTYVSIRWLDDEAEPNYVAVRGEELIPWMDTIQSGLLSPLPQELHGQGGDRRLVEEIAVQRALTSGIFADREKMRQLAAAVSALVLPRWFWERLNVERSRGREVRVRLIPSRRLSSFPWELFSDDTGRCLLELATVVYDMPATIHYKRPVLPRAYDPLGTPLYTIDPLIPHDGQGPILRPTVQWDVPGGVKIEEALGIGGGSGEVDRANLSEQLRRDPRPNRWLYVGHVSNSQGQPGTAALHLSDNTRMYGRAGPIGLHRPFMALDMFLGTKLVGVLDPSTRYPSKLGVPGTEIWPMPNRVALIACESGSEIASSEPFGLIVCAMLAGAEYVTATRWTMPTDAAFTLINRADLSPTADLILAVNAAHQQQDPVSALRDWQRQELIKWNSTGDIGHSPLLFTGVTTHHAPRRDPLTGTPLAGRG